MTSSICIWTLPRRNLWVLEFLFGLLGPSMTHLFHPCSLRSQHSYPLILFAYVLRDQVAHGAMQKSFRGGNYNPTKCTHLFGLMLMFVNISILWKSPSPKNLVFSTIHGYKSIAISILCNSYSATDRPPACKFAYITKHNIKNNFKLPFHIHTNPPCTKGHETPKHAPYGNPWAIYKSKGLIFALMKTTILSFFSPKLSGHDSKFPLHTVKNSHSYVHQIACNWHAINYMLEWYWRDQGSNCKGVGFVTIQLHQVPSEFGLQKKSKIGLIFHFEWYNLELLSYFILWWIAIWTLCYRAM